MNPDGFCKSIPGKCDGAVGKYVQYVKSTITTPKLTIWYKKFISWICFQRYNGGGQHLNRDFPHIFDPLYDDVPRQPETEAVMSWIHANNFLTSVSYFSGAKVVTYPFDSVPPHGKFSDNYMWLQCGVVNSHTGSRSFTLFRAWCPQESAALDSWWRRPPAFNLVLRLTCRE